MPTDPQLAVSYAALILAEEGVEITPDKLRTILSAAGVDDVEPIWSAILAKALKGKNVEDIVTSVQATGSIGSGGTGQTGQRDSDNTPDDTGDKLGGDQTSDDDNGSDYGSDMGLGLFE